VPLVVAVALLLAGCGAGGTGSTGSSDGRLAVVAAFYPLQFVAEKVGGERVHVTNLSKPGAEPHDLELTPKEVGALRSAALVVHLTSFQPALDAAAREIPAAANLDVTSAARLDLDDAESHGVDPHFWLDPTRLAAVGEAVATRLGQIDPTHKDTFTANAAALTRDLTALDAEFTAGLATCASRDLVTGHAAFGYLAQRYDLHQLPISGLSPDQEPNATQMAHIVAEIRARGVKTVYAETLVSRKLTDTIATETGARVAVLDPIEGLAADAHDSDYFSLMRADLAVLRTGQGCS
jgi:zinc transport system substrate-binding protein